MAEDREFNHILDECLERLLVEGRSVEECLAGYPQQAAALEPLLKTAAAARRSLAFKPGHRFKTETRRRLLTMLVEMKEKKAGRRVPFLAKLRPRWAAAVISVVLALLLTGGGLAAASGGSMPGDTLYPVKLAVERVMLQLTFSPLDKAELYAELADRRVTEIVYLAERGEAQQIEAATERLDSHLAMITSLVEPAEAKVADIALTPPLEFAPEASVDGRTESQTAAATELEVLLGQYMLQHPAALEQALITAPDSAKPAIYQAIAVAVAGYQNALNAIEP